MRVLTAQQRPLERLGVVTESPRADGYWRRSFRRLRPNRPAMAGLAVLMAFVAIALLAPLIAPYDPRAQDLRNTFAPMSWDHPMGTDNLGRDWFSRVIYGARLSLTIGIAVQLLVVAIAVPVGLVAGYFGRGTDNLLMRATDLCYAFPDLLLVILLRSVLGGGVLTLVLIIGLVTWMDTARVLRGQVLSLKEREFVDAARSLGARHSEIMTRHILPNAIGPLIIVVAFGIPRVIFIEAALSFIGFGVSPDVPSWGAMVEEGYNAIFAFPHLVLFPSIAIAVLMLAFTFLADGLRDALDPRLEPQTRLGDEARLPRPRTGMEQDRKISPAA
jgi:oligopeptide transport system permease protein